jgi:hypothetical protein
MSILDTLKAAKSAALSTFQGRELEFSARAEEATDDLSLLTNVRRAYTNHVKSILVQKFELSEKAADVYLDIDNGVLPETSMVAMLESMPRHGFKKINSTLESLAGSGKVVQSTAPALILPFIRACSKDGRDSISRREFTAVIHAYYRAQGKGLPKTSPNWPNPFASYVGNIADARLVRILIPSGYSDSTQYQINPRARKYL